MGGSSLVKLANWLGEMGGSLNSFNENEKRTLNASDAKR